MTVNELVDNLEVVLLNTTFTAEDIERSDVGTFYLSETGLKKVMRSLKNADLALIDREVYPGDIRNKDVRLQVFPVIPLAEALKEIDNGYRD